MNPLDRIPTAIPRTALVTGAARRLGRAIALTLAGAGFDIAVHCRQADADTASLAAAITALGRRAVVLEADLARPDQVACLLPQAAAALGAVGVLVNNASVFERDEWHSATRDSWDRHLEPNLRAPFVLIQDFARLLPETSSDTSPETSEGVVINVLDQRVWSLTPHFVSYTVSKAGLWALTQSLALALAPRIRVCAIGPGPALPSTHQTDEQFARQAASTPLGRGTDPDEVARAVLMLIALPSLTGQMIALDGGQHLQWAAAPHTGTADA